MTKPDAQDRRAGSLLLVGTAWAALNRESANPDGSFIVTARPAGNADGSRPAVDVKMRSGWYRMHIEILDGEPKPITTDEQEAIASIMEAADLEAAPRPTPQQVIDRLRTALKVLREPGASVAEEAGSGIPHEECEAVCTHLIGTVFEHILGDCDPATCPSDEHAP